MSKRRRASSPLTAPVSPKHVHAHRTFNSRYEQILDMWTRLDNTTPILVSKDSISKYSSLKYHRFFLDKEIITVREMNLGHKKGNNSEIYAIDIVDVEQPVILKKFVPDGDDNVEPEIEAELQKWAWRHGFAPEVKAYNPRAMIIEKCQESLTEGALTEGSKYKWNRKLSAKKFEIEPINVALGSGSLTIYSFVQSMFAECGLYNKDPNINNYMYLRGDLKQIDFGQNRFASEAKFNEFFKQLPPRLQRSELREQLVDIDSVFPPLMGWFRVFVVKPEKYDEVKTWERGAWNTYILALKQERQRLLNQLGAELEALNQETSNMWIQPLLKF